MKRPAGVTIIGVVAILGGLWQLWMSLVLFGIQLPALLPPAGIVGGTVRALTFTVGGGSLVFGVLGVVFGIGALQLRPWSWTLGVVLYILDLFAALALLVAGGATLGVAVPALLSAAIIAYLYTPEVRTAFGHEAHHGAAAGTHGPSPA